MAKPLSEDLRVRIIEAVEEEGMSRRGAAKRFGVSATSAIRFLAAWRAAGAVRADRQGGDRRSQRIEAHGERILGAVAAKPDLTLAELAEFIKAETGETFAPSSLWRFFDRRGVTFKKNRARGRAG